MSTTSAARKFTVVKGGKQRSPAVADPREVAKAAKQLSVEFVSCRAYGHNWRLARATKVTHGHIEVWIDCPRCKTNRRELISRTGEVLSRSRDYAEGYLLHGLGRITDRSAFRRESVDRMLAMAK